MFHHRLSVICVSDAITQYFHVLDATSSAFLSLAISESVFWRMSRAEAARDPRRRLFAPLLLKLLLLQKCNKFPCNGVRVSVRAGRLIFSSLLFLLRYLKKMEKLNVSETHTPWCLRRAYDQGKIPQIASCLSGVFLPSSLCFLYALVPADASQGLCTYMNEKARYVFRPVVNEDCFGVRFDSEYSVCLRSIQPGFKVFHFNRHTVNSNEFPTKKERKNLFREEGEKSLSRHVFDVCHMCFLLSALEKKGLKKTTQHYLMRFNDWIHQKWLPVWRELGKVWGHFQPCIYTHPTELLKLWSQGKKNGEWELKQSSG